MSAQSFRWFRCICVRNHLEIFLVADYTAFKRTVDASSASYWILCVPTALLPLSFFPLPKKCSKFYRNMLEILLGVTGWMCPRFGNMLLLLSCTLPSAIMCFFNTFCEGAWRFLNNALKFIYNTIAFAQQNIPRRTWKYWKHCLYENRNRRRPHAHVCNPIKKPKKHEEMKTSLLIVSHLITIITIISRMNSCLNCPWVDLLGIIRLNTVVANDDFCILINWFSVWRCIENAVQRTWLKARNTYRVRCTGFSCRTGGSLWIHIKIGGV
jgi:hypothetical protein